MKMTNGNFFASSPYRSDTGAPNLHTKADARSGQIISKEENAKFVRARDTHPPVSNPAPKKRGKKQD